MNVVVADQPGVMEEMAGVRMGVQSGHAYDERVLVFAPKGGEAENLCTTLSESGIKAMNCSGVEELCQSVEAGAGAAIVVGELLEQLLSSCLKQALSHQLAWSDFPLIVLAGGTVTLEASWQILRASEPSANAILLERPVSAITLSSTVRAALRSRRRQYELRDLAGRRHAEENLLKEKLFTDAAINSLPGIFYVLDAEGRNLRRNKAFEEITGYSAGEIDGMHMHGLDFVPGEFKALVAQKMREVFTLGQGTVDADLLTKQGARIPYFFTGRKFMVEQKSYLIGMGIDMSERKRVEKSLEEAKEQIDRHASQLEKLVAERTTTMEASLQSISGVLYHVAHDLRAPLRAMQGFTTILEEEYAAQLGETGGDYARRIAAAASRMDKLIHDLLAYGRLAHVSCAPAKLDLNRQIKNVIRKLDTDIRATHASVQVDRLLPKVWADSAMLDLILINLLKNALAFVAPGNSPRIEIHARAVAPARIRISVQDHGLGVALEHQERIFRVFERLHPQNVESGTGIGLAIVRKAAERMGGAAGVESKPGIGSHFWFELPAVRKKE